MNTVADHAPRQQALRRLGALAHQIRASLRAADRFATQGVPGDRDSASWLVCTALELAREVADELDGLAKGLREAGSDTARQQALAPWRKIAHQLHAACRAADLFLEQDSRDEQDTGTWLVASAQALADRLTAALDDGVGAWATAEPAKRVATVAPRAAAG
jgi:hypothetical protein